MRRINSSNPVVVKKHTLSICKQIILHRLNDKLTILIKHWNNINSVNRKKLLNSIDQQFVREMCCAKKRCRTLHIREIMYPPTLHRIGKIWNYWKQVLKSFVKQKRVTSRLKQRAKHLDIVLPQIVTDEIHIHSQQRRKRRRLNLNTTSLVIRNIILQMNNDDDE